MNDIIDRQLCNLGPPVPAEVVTYLHAYGDSRADDDGFSGLRIGEAILALRRWAAELQAAERERCAKIADEHAKRTFTWGSENADLYHAQADWAEAIAKSIRQAPAAPD